MMGFHFTKSCKHAEIENKQDDKSLEDFIKNNKDVMRCGNCNTTIYRKELCDHIICPTCKQHFCILCGFTYEKDSKVYEHMREKHPEVNPV